MDKDKKELLIGIDVFLWILVFIPGAVYVNELVQAYKNGSSIGFNENAITYYGWAGVKTQIDLILWLGAAGFWLFVSLVVVTVVYTVFITRKIKGNKEVK